MFQKRIIELITVLFFWLILVPYIYKYCMDQKYLEFDMNHFVDSISKQGIFALIVLIVYIVVYRVVIFMYTKMKLFDLELSNTLKKAHNDPDSVSKKTHYQSVSLESVDVVDSGKQKKAPPTPKMIRTISNPLLIESELARIHIQHETKPLEGGKPRTAPPVPGKGSTLPRLHTNGVIMSPKVLTPKIEIV